MEESTKVRGLIESWRSFVQFKLMLVSRMESYEMEPNSGGAPIEALGSDDTNEICVSKHRYIVC